MGVGSSGLWGLLAVYWAIALLAAIATLRENIQKNGRVGAWGTLGVSLCAIWPLVFALICIEVIRVRRRSG
jgi:hypothetical protein